MPGRSSSRLRSKKRKSSDSDVAETQSVAAEETTASPSSTNGSFILEVANGQERVRIPHDQSQILRDKSQFFEHAFCHGTTETKSGILHKPDWSLETANLILQLLTEGSIPVPTAPLEPFRVAADQILLPFTIPHPVFGPAQDLCGKRRILELVQETRPRCGHSFLLRRCDLTDRYGETEDESEEDSDDSSSDSDDNSRTRLFQKKGRVDLWLQFLKQGVMMVDAKKGFRIQLGSKTTNKEGEEDGRCDDDSERNFRVYYSSPLHVTVTHLCSGLRQIRDYEESDDEDLSHANASFRLTFQIYCGFYDHCLDLTEDLDVCWEGEFNTDGLADDVTITGAVGELSALLVHVQDYIVPCRNTQKIALFLHNPDWRVLGRLIHATQQCHDNPNTLLWDAEINDFFTMKTLRDTKVLLDLLSKDSSPLAKDGGFILTEKSVSVVTRLGNNWETR